MDKKHTLETIAELAGVSRATVSRVINKKNNVKKETKDKVWEVIEKVNYHPNASAKSLASKKSNNIGIIFWGSNPEYLSNPIYYEILQGIQRETLKYDYNLVLYSTSDNSKNAEKLTYKIIGEKNVDGIIILGTKIYSKYLKLFSKNNLPTVLVGKRPNKNSIPYVYTNYKDGIYQATKYLIKNNLKKIVLIESDVDQYFEKDKIEGYKKAINEYKDIYDFEKVYEVNNNILNNEREQEFNDFIKSDVLKNNPDGIICASDIMAQKAIKIIDKLDLKIPDDISIIGFNDINSSAHFNPSLTTVRQDKISLGTNAVQLLLEIFDSKKPKNRILPAELIIREST